VLGLLQQLLQEVQATEFTPAATACLSESHSAGSRFQES
jgi:hypothetical protein